MAANWRKNRAGQVCACGCRELLQGRHVIDGLYIKGHTKAVADRVRDGMVAAPYTIPCQYCGKPFPSLWPKAKFCNERTTGRDCATKAKAAARLASQDKLREAMGRVKRSPWRDPRFNREMVCLTPSPCKYYAEGYGCPPTTTPCSDRTELGRLWRFEESGGSPCWVEEKR